MAINYPSIHPGQYPYMAREPSKKFETVTPPRKPPILCPTIHPGVYPHYGKEPNTNYLQRGYEERFLKKNLAGTEKDVDLKANEDTDIKQLNDEIKRHVEYLQFQREVKNKMKAKIKAYEDSVDIRRQKLKELLQSDECQYYQETIEHSFKKEGKKLEEKKRKLAIIKKQKEEEREVIARKKTLEHYINLCPELTPAVFKKHLIESKHAQLQQMRENEARKQAERELDRLWYELSLKEEKASIEREEREAMARKANELLTQQTLAMQVRGRELSKVEEIKMKREDQLEIKKINEELRQQELERLKQKRKDQENLLRDLHNQMKIHEEQLRREKEGEEEINRMFIKYNNIELEKEKANEALRKQELKRDFDIRKAYYDEMKKQKREEEKKLDELLEMYRKKVQKEYEDAQCKVIEARRELHKSVIQGRAQQIAHKKMEAENQLRAQQAENEMLQLALETNMRLQEESNRLHKQAVMQYREDLQKQIEYNNELRERERQELERQIQKGKEEEEKYQKLAEEVIRAHTQNPTNKHPFRRVLETYNCRC